MQIIKYHDAINIPIGCNKSSHQWLSVDGKVVVIFIFMGPFSSSDS